MLVVDAVGQHRVVLGYMSARVHLGDPVLSFASGRLLVQSKFLIRINRRIFLQIMLFKDSEIQGLDIQEATLPEDLRHLLLIIFLYPQRLPV